MDKCSDAKENPFHFFEKLEGRADFRLRVGDCRVIAEINREISRIDVTLVDHRKRIYKRLKEK